MGTNNILFLFFGLVIFLYGMQNLEKGLAAMGENRVRDLLRRYTNNTIASIMTGTLITALLQSSSMVTLIMMAMVGARMLPLKNAVGVVIGANLGTTFTGWIVATIGFKVNMSGLIIPLIGLGGFAFLLTPKVSSLKSMGLILPGLGLLIFGLDTMKSSVEVLPELIDFEAFSDLPAITWLLLGTILTAVIQSSSATMIITLTLLDAKLIDLYSAAAFIIGADLGTTSTSLLGTLTGNVVRKRLAMSHVIFNITTAVMAFVFLLPFLPQFLNWLNIADELYGVVLFHSSFNAIGLILFIPLTAIYSRWLESFFVEKVKPVTVCIHTVPPEETKTALNALEKEVSAVFEKCKLIFNEALDGKSNNDLYDEIKKIEGKMVQYAKAVNSEETTSMLLTVRHFVSAAKNIRDISNDWSKTEGFKINDEIEKIRLFGKQGIAKLPVEVTQDLDSLESLRESLHAELYKLNTELYKDIGNKDIQPDIISTVLNLAREVYSSQVYFIKGFEKV